MLNGTKYTKTCGAFEGFNIPDVVIAIHPTTGEVTIEFPATLDIAVKAPSGWKIRTRPYGAKPSLAPEAMIKSRKRTSPHPDIQEMMGRHAVECLVTGTSMIAQHDRMRFEANRHRAQRVPGYDSFRRRVALVRKEIETSLGVSFGPGRSREHEFGLASAHSRPALRSSIERSFRRYL